MLHQFIPSQSTRIHQFWQGQFVQGSHQQLVGAYSLGMIYVLDQVHSFYIDNAEDGEEDEDKK